MKYIRKFENSTLPQIGDYVICVVDELLFKDLNYFLKNNIGLIVNHNRINDEFLVSFDDASEKDKFDVHLYSVDHSKLEICFSTREIKYFSKDKIYIESLINTNKYNL